MMELADVLLPNCICSSPGSAKKIKIYLIILSIHVLVLPERHLRLVGIAFLTSSTFSLLFLLLLLGLISSGTGQSFAKPRLTVRY